MKIEVKNRPYLFICDNTNQLDSCTAFVLTEQNFQYKEYALKNSSFEIISVKDCFDILNINKSLRVIGITGTNGKTTTSAIIYSMLLDLGKKSALQGTRGCFINDICIDSKSLTTPPILQTLNNMRRASDDGCEYFIMEVSSHAIAQKRIESIDFALKIFTNISQDHLDFHKTIKEYTDVKSSFFSDHGLKLINKDDENIKYSLKNTLTYGIENAATYKAVAYGLKNGVEAVIQKGSQAFKISSNLYGKFNLYNILAAVGAVDMMENVSHKELHNALLGFAGVEGRMQVINEKPLVIVDFAHTPDGMLKVFEAMKDRNIVVVFGAGGNRDKTKRPLMGKIAQKYSRKIYITSDNPRDEEPQEIIKDIMRGVIYNSSIYVDIDRKAVIQMALKSLKQDEILLILGKGDEDYQEIKGIKYPFDDRVVVKEFFANLNEKIKF